MRRFAALALAFVACARHDAQPPFRLRIAAIGNLAPLSPEGDEGYETLVQGLVFEPLIQPTVDGQWKSKVVLDWRRGPDGQHRFRVRPDVTFSDGSALASHDLEIALGARVGMSEKDGWVTAQVLDGGAQSEAESLAGVVWRSSAAGPIGTGPFVVATQDERHVLLRRRVPAPHAVMEVELVSVPTPRDAFGAVFRGDVDMLLMPDEGQLELLAGVDRLKVIRGPGLQSVAAVFNTALLTADDRRRMVELLPLDGIATAYGALCKLEGGVRPREQLGPGPVVDLLVTNTEPASVRAALALRRALGSRGGMLSVVTFEEARKRVASGSFGLLLTNMQTWPTDLSTSKWMTGSPRNPTGYSNQRVDAAVRASDFALAQKELAADPPALIICRLDRAAAIDARLIDARLGEYDMLDTLEKWHVAP